MKNPIQQSLIFQKISNTSGKLIAQKISNWYSVLSIAGIKLVPVLSTKIHALFHTYVWIYVIFNIRGINNGSKLYSSIHKIGSKVNTNAIYLGLYMLNVSSSCLQWEEGCEGREKALKQIPEHEQICLLAVQVWQSIADLTFFHWRNECKEKNRMIFTAVVGTLDYLYF